MKCPGCNLLSCVLSSSSWSTVSKDIFSLNLAGKLEDGNRSD
jgi:hypothetical protein